MGMFLAWQHNPQCEVHCEGVIHWGYWLEIGASWALPSLLVGLAAQWLVLWLLNLLGALGRNNEETHNK